MGGEPTLVIHRDTRPVIPATQGIPFLGIQVEHVYQLDYGQGACLLVYVSDSLSIDYTAVNQVCYI